MATSAAELELMNNISSAAARENFDKWWKEDRAAEINERWRIKRKFLDAKGDDLSLQSKYVLVDVLSTPGDHKKLTELLTAQIQLKHATPTDTTTDEPTTDDSPDNSPPDPPTEDTPTTEAAPDKAKEPEKIWVRIQGCNYVSTDPVCASLAEFQTIEKLSLGDAIEADDAGAVTTMLGKMPNLTSLDLANNKLETEGLKSILSGLKEHPGVTDVDMSGCSIGTSGGKHIAEFLDANPLVQRLLLNGNKLGIYGVQDLCKGLPNNTNLTTLGLFFNNMGEDGCEAILDVLRDSNEAINEESNETTKETPDVSEPTTNTNTNTEDNPTTKEGENAVPTEEGDVPPPAPPESPKKVRDVKNRTLLSVEVGENKQSPAQQVELDKILELNNIDAREQEAEAMKQKELRRLEQLAEEKRVADEAAAAEARKAEAKAPTKPAAKKAGAKPSPKPAKPAAKPAAKAAKKPAAKSSLPAIGKK